MFDRITTLHNLIAQQRQLGLQPREMHMSEETYLGFVTEAKLSPVAPQDTRSVIARLRLPYDGPKPYYEFDGVRLIPNSKVPGSAIILRPEQLMGQPDWLERHIRFGEAPQPAVDAQTTPWHRREEKSPDGAGEAEKGVLETLGDGGGVNPTTVLMKAMEGLDTIQDVVVLRFYKDRSIDLCSTMNRYGVIGGLQAAMGHVMNGND